MNRQRKRTSSKHNLNYNELESKHLLAAVINGTDANDTLDISYVDDTTIKYSINDSVTQRLDVTEGLKVRLQGGEDIVNIHPNIVADVQLISVEEILVDGKDNDWQVGFVQDTQNLNGPYLSAGTINESITFLGAKTLRGFAGNDAFTVNSENSSGLRIFGGGEDDIFRFSATADGWPSESGIKAMGESGLDRFVFHGDVNVIVDGGLDFDVVDLQPSNQQVSLRSGELMNAVERIIAPAGTNSNVKAPSAHIGDFSYSWVIDGSLTTLTNESSGWTIELENFQRFEGSSHGFDRVWVLATADDVELWDADWVQISSDMDASKGDLNSILHDVSIVRSAGYYEVIGDIVEYFGDEDGVINPRVVISDVATSEGNVATFDAERSITGIAVGDIKFLDHTEDEAGSDMANQDLDSEPEIPSEGEFQPEIIVHGSETAADQFIVESIWTKTSIYAHGGDDEFLVGSSIEAGNGDLRTIAGTLDLIGGMGSDRMVANNHHGQHDAYRLEPGKLSESPTAEGSNPLMQILFDATLELVRINGSGMHATQFDVFPSQQTKFVVDGMLQQSSNDRLQLVGDVDGQLFNFDGSGSWQLDDGYQPVHFYGIEEMPEIAPKMLDGFFDSFE